MQKSNVRRMTKDTIDANAIVCAQGGSRSRATEKTEPSMEMTMADAQESVPPGGGVHHCGNEIFGIRNFAKWEYVRNNPFRKGLVANADDWPYQGVLNDLEWYEA